MISQMGRADEPLPADLAFMGLLAWVVMPPHVVSKVHFGLESLETDPTFQFGIAL